MDFINSWKMIELNTCTTFEIELNICTKVFLCLCLFLLQRSMLSLCVLKAGFPPDCNRCAYSPLSRQFHGQKSHDVDLLYTELLSFFKKVPRSLTLSAVCDLNSRGNFKWNSQLAITPLCFSLRGQDCLVKKAFFCEKRRAGLR